MSEPLQELLDAIREAAQGSAWSRGVELARGGAVSGERDDGSEVVLQISTRGGLVCPTVILYPGDVDWECDCGTRDDVCEHVAAAVIALRQARRSGQALPAAGGGAGRIGYRLTRENGGLRFERAVVTDEGETRLTTTLAAIGSGRVDGPSFVAARTDVEIERALGTRLRGELPRGLWPRLLALLARSSDVQLDGAPTTTSGDRVGWVGRVEDDGEGFLLTVGRDPRIEELFRDDVALREGVLCPMGEPGLTGRELEAFGRGQHFPAGDAAALVTEVLPSLADRIPLDVKTQRLPETTSAPPRILIQTERKGDALSVLPTLVYGDPAVARVDGGRLVPLGGKVPLRDEAAERALARRLQNDLEMAPGHRVEVRGAEALDLAERLSRWPGGVEGKALGHFRLESPLVPHFEATDVGFRFGLRSGEEGREADPGRALAAWQAGESMVPLLGGGFAALPADWLARFGDRVADLLAARDATGALPRAAFPDLAHLCDELEAPMPPDVAALRDLVSRANGIPEAALPEDLTATLRDYQRAGIDWLAALREAGLGALLADDMGLGKTLQALCAVQGRTLVVAPTSVLHNWAAEAARFRPALRTAIYHGPGRRLDPAADVTLTTWALLRLDAAGLGGVHWDTVVLDEAQAIKNPDSQVARAAFGLDARFRIAMTGTPVENRLEELWSQLHFVTPGLLGGRRDFEERYAGPIASGDAGAAPRLRERIRPFVLRRTKAEVAPELPPRTEVVLRAELSESERRLYDAVHAAARTEVVERLGSGANPLRALEALLRLRQAACHPSLVPGHSAETSAKISLLLEELDESTAEGHKALVFSQWTSLLDLVEPHLDAAGLGWIRLDGSTRDRAGVVDAFQADGGPPVMLLSLRAGGVGLNLTAADCVFILDPWWNPAVEDQAADRAHRIGQDRPVMVYRLVAADTVEERVAALQQRKRALADAALGGTDRAATLTRDELLELLA